MRGDFLDGILVREASKSTIIYNTTYYYTLGRVLRAIYQCARASACTDCATAGGPERVRAERARSDGYRHAPFVPAHGPRTQASCANGLHPSGCKLELTEHRWLQ